MPLSEEQFEDMRQSLADLKDQNTRHEITIREMARQLNYTNSYILRKSKVIDAGTTTIEEFNPGQQIVI